MVDKFIALTEVASQLMLNEPAPLDAKAVCETLAQAQAQAYDGYRTYCKELGKSIVFKGDADALSYSTDGGGTTEAVVVADVASGGVKVGDSISAGTSLQALVEQIFSAVQFPTFVLPTLGLTAITASCESGERLSFTLVPGLSRGSINGARVAGVWQSATAQNPRSGAVNKYTLNTVDITATGSLLYTNYQMKDGANTFTAVAYYNQGPQPIDSKGNNYNTPLSAGTVSKAVTCTGQRGHFFGTHADVLPLNNMRIRTLAGKSRGAINGTAFTLTIPAGALQVVFAYPATLRTVSSVKHVEGLGAEVKGVFTETALNIEGANAYSAIAYRIYTYMPAVAFSSAQTYTVTI